MSLKTFQVDYVRSAIKFALFKNRGNENLFDDNDFDIFSFYEHLVEDSEVQRYVERYQTLIERQNRQELVGYGIVAVTDTPTIVNNKSCFISPFEWSCSIRVTKENRDKTIETLYEVMELFRGKKVDIACFNNGKLQPVGTIGNTYDNNVNDYDFIGDISGTITTNAINTKLASYNTNYGFVVSNVTKVFIENDGILKLYEKDTSNDWNEITNVIPDHTSFQKMKLDISFTDVKMNEPYTLNTKEYCDIIFGGGATLTKNNIKLGNDLVKVFINKDKIICSDDGTGDFAFTTPTIYMLDPLEVGGGNSATTIANKLRSNAFVENSHTDSIAITHEYTFIYDTSIQLLNDWYEYAYYGDQKYGSGNSLQQTSLTPNIIYTIKEIYCSWANIKAYTYKGKIVEDIDIGNTDSDVETIKVDIQLQGTNN